ncbi:PP2C family protein-serine/threonine phosphatase [Streptomyces wuyuanensis]|uniref:protein-serine/threonine phosphatase n=1 Tax=Streptomyces wuyuanensis TaxID=1196353 RepID=A0A1G9YZ22_9ACTN|nr:GAF domain-containing SpoIIE family protein phosphatase [Streptomyces wuyuanensis]SDN14324.1 Serine phosphatase RsbU, regulator of sigma subunit [Streptomyces wuyuanensis]
MDEYDVDAALQQALDRLTLLADVNSALAATVDAREGLRRVCRMLAQRMGDWCAIDVLTERDEIGRVCATHRGPVLLQGEETEAPLPKPPPDATGPLARVLQGAGPFVLAAAEIRPRERMHGWDLGQARIFEQLDVRSAVIAPLRARREVLGALTIARWGSRPALSDDDLMLVEDLSHRVGLAIDNARLHRQTEHIAERLQRSLLPALPGAGPLRMAARYAPSQATAQVGGDWYDSFVLPDGDTAVIIGDVAGHDLQSTVEMSQLRNMLRGIACDRQEPPGAILRRLDLALHTLYPEFTATCLYALIQGPEGGPWQLNHSSAGHLPPLLVTRDGDTRYLQDARGMLLGVDPEQPRTSASEPLPAHSTLLLYTDGLVERRRESIDHGLTRLRQHAAALARHTPDSFCDELLTGLAPTPTDDVALLAVRIPEPTATPAGATGTEDGGA